MVEKGIYKKIKNATVAIAAMNKEGAEDLYFLLLRRHILSEY
jgi:hypothetical protein